MVRMRCMVSGAAAARRRSAADLRVESAGVTLSRLWRRRVMPAIKTTEPTARRRPRWRIPLIALGALVVVAGGVVATYPLWADGFIEAAVVRRLEALTGAPVTMDGFDLEYSAVTMRGVGLTIDADTTIRLERVDIAFDREALWSAQAIVTEVEVAGGAIKGDVAAFERLAAQMASRMKPREDRGGGRVHLMPQKARVTGLRLASRGGEVRSASSPSSSRM